MVECLFSMGKALGLISSTEEDIKGEERREGERLERERKEMNVFTLYNSVCPLQPFEPTFQRQF